MGELITKEQLDAYLYDLEHNPEKFDRDMPPHPSDVSESVLKVIRAVEERKRKEKSEFK
jgi:hypothetical protein